MRAVVDLDDTITAQPELFIPLCAAIMQAGFGSGVFIVTGNPNAVEVLARLGMKQGTHYQSVHVISGDDISEHAQAKLEWMVSHGWGKSDLLIDNTQENCTAAITITNAMLFMDRITKRTNKTADRSVEDVIGRNVRRFVPPTETRAVHGPILAALTTAHAPALAAAMTTVATDAADISDDDTDDDGNLTADAAAAAPRTAAMLAGIAGWAANIVDNMQANGEDAANVADRVSSDVAAAADTASTLDTPGASGWRFVAEDNPCPDCAALDGNTYGLDESDDLPPVHGSCGCTVRTVTSSQRGQLVEFSGTDRTWANRTDELVPLPWRTEDEDERTQTVGTGPTPTRDEEAHSEEGEDVRRIRVQHPADGVLQVGVVFAAHHRHSVCQHDTSAANEVASVATHSERRTDDGTVQVQRPDIERCARVPRWDDHLQRVTLHRRSEVARST